MIHELKIHELNFNAAAMSDHEGYEPCLCHSFMPMGSDVPGCNYVILDHVLLHSSMLNFQCHDQSSVDIATATQSASADHFELAYGRTRTCGHLRVCWTPTLSERFPCNYAYVF